ncbi:hypothetical protein [Fodinicurvata sp. EGI_FJ10296]|uniref:tetratricopeptide repeat protein n=1 Tax=Fodinicurvata sp. EGI_FJ10296 TaxID=3231908 RepID=UPI00345699EA
MRNAIRAACKSAIRGAAILAVASLGTVGPALAVDPALYATMDQDGLAPYIEAAEAAIAEDPNDLDALRTLGIAHHNLGSIEVGGAPSAAQEYLERVLEIDPDDQMARAYLGSATTMRARDSWNVITRVSNANRGIALIDEAVRADRDNIRLRLLRANHSYSLPDMFERHTIALDDFRMAVDRMEEEIGSSPEAIAQIHVKIAELTPDREEEETHLERAIDLAPDSEWGERAQEALNQ